MEKPFANADPASFSDCTLVSALPSGTGLNHLSKVGWVILVTFLCKYALFYTVDIY